MEREEDNLEDQMIVLTLENAETGQVRGTCQIFTHVGQTSPFYSYRLGVLPQSSREIGRTFRAKMLGLTTDVEGDRKSGVKGKIVSVRGDLGGRRLIKKKHNHKDIPKKII